MSGLPRDLDRFFDGTTFGMEYDCGDFDRTLPLPGGHSYCTDEVASHGPGGVGVDPQLRWNLYGGEVQFVPQTSEAALLRECQSVLGTCLAHDLRFPGTIHVHVRIPNLLERPDLIKELVFWTTEWWSKFAPLIYQSEQPDNDGAYNAWLYQCNHDVKHMTYDNNALIRMMKARTAREIALELHNHPTDWKNEWHTDPDVMRVKRPAVNFGHLALNETIEFRSFVTTTNPAILRNIIEFPLNFLRMALTKDPDPLRIVRGVRFQERPYSLPNYGGVAEKTTGYFADQRRGIALLLVNGDITVADLNNPPYWINKGFQ